MHCINYNNGEKNRRPLGEYFKLKFLFKTSEILSYHFYSLSQLA